MDGFERIGNLVGDDGGHARPVFEFLRREERFLHLALLVFSVCEPVGVVVDAEGDDGDAADKLDCDVGERG